MKKSMLIVLIVVAPLLIARWVSRGKGRTRRRLIEEARETQASFRTA